MSFDSKPLSRSIFIEQRPEHYRSTALDSTVSFGYGSKVHTTYEVTGSQSATLEREVSRLRDLCSEKERRIQQLIEELNEARTRVTKLEHSYQDEMSRKMRQVQSELDRCLVTLEDYEREIEAWRIRYVQLERESGLAIEDARSHWEEQIRARIEGELRSKTIEFESTLRAMRGERDRLSCQVEELVARIRETEREEELHLGDARRHWEEQVQIRLESELRSKHTEYETRIREFSLERDELRREVEGYRSRISEMELDFSRRLESARHTWEQSAHLSMESELRSRLVDIEARHSRAASEKEGLEIQIQNLRRQLSESEENFEGRLREARMTWEQSVRVSLENELKHMKDDCDSQVRLVEDLRLRLREAEALKAQPQVDHPKPEHLEKARREWEADFREQLEFELRGKLGEYEGRIEGLMAEIERWRKEAEDYRRRIGEIENSWAIRLREEKESWGVSIESGLRRQLGEKEGRIKALEEELERYKALANSREAQHSKLHIDYIELERGIPQKIEAARSEWELNIKNHLQVEIRAKLEEIERSKIALEHSLEEKSKEIEHLKKRLTDQEQDFVHYSEEMKRKFALEIRGTLEEKERRVGYDWESKMREKEAEIRKELEGKIYLLIKENDDLVANISLRKREIDEIRLRIEAEVSLAIVLLFLHSYLIWEQEKVEREWQGRLVHLRGEHEKEMAHLRQSVVEIEQKMELVHRENEKIERLYKEKSKELQGWVARYRELEEDSRKSYEEVVFRFEEYKRVNSSLDTEAKFRAERTAYETQIVQLKQRIVEFEELNRVLRLDAKKLAKSNSEKFKELDQMRAEFLRMESQHQKEHHESRSQLDIFKRTSLDVQEITMRHAAEVARFKNQVHQLEQVNANLKSERDKLYDLLERRKIDETKNQKTIEELRERLSHVERKEGGDPGSDYIQELEERLRDSEFDRKKLEEIYQKNALELAEKNEELIGKIKELDALKRQYQISLHDLGNVSSSIVSSSMVRKSLH